MLPAGKKTMLPDLLEKWEWVWVCRNLPFSIIMLHLPCYNTHECQADSWNHQIRRSQSMWLQLLLYKCKN
jgi:hypothetical protein